MLSIQELVSKAHQLEAIATYGATEFAFTTKEINSNQYAMMEQVIRALSVQKGFMEVVDGDDDFNLLVPHFASWPLKIDRTGEDEDPPVWMNRNGESYLAAPCASILLLTELAYALYQHGKYVFEYGDLKNYRIMRQHFLMFAKESSFPNKIWMHKNMDCFNLVLANEEKQYFVAANEEVLERVKNELKEKKATDKQQNGKPFESSWIMQAVITHNTLSGNVALPYQKEPVHVILESEASNPPDFPRIILQAQQIVLQLTPTAIFKMVDKVADAVTKAAYEQTSLSPDSQDARKLSDAMKLVLIRFVDNDAILSFQAENIFPNKMIYVQINRSLQLLEVTIS